MEAGQRAAGNGDEHQREDGQALGVLVGPLGGIVEFRAADEHHHGDAHGHEDQDGPENGVEAADDLVDGHNGRQEVIGEDHADPEGEVQGGGGQLGQQGGRGGHEDHAHQDEQHHGEDAHDLFGGAAQVVAHEGGHVGPAL